MGINKKLITLLVFLLLAFAALNFFLILRYKARLSKPNETKLIDETKQADEAKKTLIPYINTFELPPAEVGAIYQSEIVASLSGVHKDIKISVNGLPEGLTLGKCLQSLDSKFLSEPNTLIICRLQGTPVKAGTYQLKITSSTTADYPNAENTISLSVAEP